MSEQIIFDYSKLRGKIREVFTNESDFAEALGIGRVSLSKRLNNALDFSGTEIYHSCNLLGIKKDEVSEYFFTQKVQEHELVKA